jgi:hypothetical protein
MTEQKAAFWDVIEIFDKEGLLPQVMIIGSWAEFIYQHCMDSGFVASLRTRDIDIFYHNLMRPQGVNIRISDSMKEKGFIYNEHRITGVGKFIKGDLLEIEFLTRVLGIGEQVNEIPALKLRASGIREINMLAQYPLDIECNDYIIKVPEPEAYILQKLLINPKRKQEDKKEKDIQAVKMLLGHVDMQRLIEIFDGMTEKEREIVDSVKKEHFIDF